MDTEHLENNGQGEDGGAAQIGNILQRRRREKGLTLRDVEQATKIRSRYLEGLEREDYAALPDAVYVHGFLKTYANFLGLDGERLSRELKDRRASRREGRRLDHEGPAGSEPERPLVTPVGGLGDPADRRRIPARAIIAVVLALLVLAAVVGVLYFIGRGTQTAAPDPAQSPSAESSGPESSSQGEPSVGDTANETSPAGDDKAAGGATNSKNNNDAQTERATVSVVGGSSGITVWVDGAVSYDGNAQPGFSRTFEGRRSISVSATNGGVVEVEANGRKVGRLGNPGQPVTREFTPDPGTA